MNLVQLNKLKIQMDTDDHTGLCLYRLHPVHDDNRVITKETRGPLTTSFLWGPVAKVTKPILFFKDLFNDTI